MLSAERVALAIAVLTSATIVLVVTLVINMRTDLAHGRGELSKECKESWDMGTFMTWVFYAVILAVAAVGASRGIWS